MTDLGEYLREAARRRRLAGVWDCAAFPADWVMMNGYCDPLAAWRGRYDSEASGLDLIADAGGLVPLFAAGLASVGVRPVDGEFEPGDVGVVQVGDAQAGAVFTGKRWALVADSGMAFASIEREHIAAAWRVSDG